MCASDSSLSTNRRDRNRSRERLLRAARTLFAAHGYHRTSTQQIAALAGVNQVTVFRLFGNKRALFLKVLRDSMQGDSLDGLQRTLQSSKQDTVVFGRLTSHLGEIFEPTVLRLLLFGGLEQPQQLRKLLRSRLRSFYGQVGTHIQQRVDCGALRALDPASMCRALVGMLIYEQLFRDLFEEGKGFSAQHKSPQLHYLDIWLNGVLADRHGSLPAKKAPRAGLPKRSAAGGSTLPKAASG